MKTYIIGALIAMALLISGCHSENKKELSIEAKEAHEGDLDHGHDHGHDHDHDHDRKHEHNHQDDHDHEHDHSAHTDGIRFTKEQAKAVGLVTETVAPGTFRQVIKTSGHIQPSQGDEAIIVATSNGIVSFVNPSISDGAAIGSGQAIVTISARNLLDGDPSAKAKIEYETALAELKRTEGLIKDTIVSAKEYEQVKLRYETAKNAYEAQSGNASPMGVRVTSPISGYLKNRFVGQGEYVSVGQPIATVSQNKRLQLKAEVSENYFSNLKAITGANFKMAYDKTVYKLSDMNGRLLSFGKASDGQSFYIPVTFEFDNIGDIIPGAFAEVYLLSIPHENVLSVPLSALTEEQGLYFVYLELHEEEYKKQEVTIGQDDGERIQILTGLAAGDKVVTKGVYQVKLAAISSVMPEGHTHNH